MLDLKAEGKVVTAQATTTKRTSITTEKLLWNHINWEVNWEEIKALNGNDFKFKNIQDHFSLNLDKICFMASARKLKVITSKAKHKLEKNVQDCRESITVIRVGSVAGTEVISFSRH